MFKDEILNELRKQMEFLELEFEEKRKENLISSEVALQYGRDTQRIENLVFLLEGYEWRNG